MDTEQSFLHNTALKLGLPVEGTLQAVLSEAEISTRLGQIPPYLAVRRALVCQKDAEHALLAEVRFGPETCDGHYPGHNHPDISPTASTGYDKRRDHFESRYWQTAQPEALAQTRLRS